MKNEDLAALGIPAGDPTKLAFGLIKELAQQGKRAEEMKTILSDVLANSDDFLDHEHFGEFAQSLQGTHYVAREKPAPYHQWGEDLDPQSVEQMANACKLPVSVAGALMPDAHLGYGLPIGGVLAAENAVIPYAVGVDIACRMKMTVLDIPVKELDDERGRGRLTRAIEKETRFGIGATFKDKREHDVLDRDWSVTRVTRENKNKAWTQLGTSGSGNHFVEFGIYTPQADEQDLQTGKAYLALLSHSGSRGAGSAVAGHYSKLAQELHPELPKELIHLAWLDMDSEAGQEYWAAMELMGEYAAANHACIHRHIAEHLKAEVLLDLENHHNFAWKEEHFGKEVIVHRKGATPAGDGVLGIIPGSMASPGYVVKGKGNADSLKSASHGAGRVMSRKKASQTLNWEDAKTFLNKQNVTLISAGLDEVPFVYKNIDEVMANQADLVEILGRFDPRLVKMAPSGERPED